MKFYVQIIYKTKAGDISNPEVTSYLDRTQADAGFYTKTGAWIKEANTVMVSATEYDELQNQLNRAVWNSETQAQTQAE